MLTIGEELAELERLDKAAPSGWYWNVKGEGDYLYCKKDGIITALLRVGTDSYPMPDDAVTDLVVEARNALPKLVAEVRLLRAHMVDAGTDEHEAGVDCNICETRNGHESDCLLRPDRKLGEP